MKTKNDKDSKKKKNFFSSPKNKYTHAPSIFFLVLFFFFFFFLSFFLVCFFFPQLNDQKNIKKKIGDSPYTLTRSERFRYHRLGSLRCLLTGIIRVVTAIGIIERGRGAGVAIRSC